MAGLSRLIPRPSALAVQTARGISATVGSLSGESSSSSSQPSSESRRYGTSTVVAAAAFGIVGGIAIGDRDSRLRRLELPGGSFRACCDSEALSEKQQKLPERLSDIVGAANVRKDVTMQGSRLGRGTAMAVVRPGTIAEVMKVLEVCVQADVAVIAQGANTSLTGASVPRNKHCDRPTVVLNMKRLNKILPVGKEGHQVLCFSGAGIFDLQERMKSYDRDSHSVLGSIFLNPSVGAGVAYGSGGTQIRKGPAFTERALYCRVQVDGSLELVDTLGLQHQGLKAVEFLDAAEELKVEDLDPKCKRPASWPDYAATLTKLDGSVSRFNADTRGIDCNRSEGKVVILATLHDTFPLPAQSKLVWISCKDYDVAQDLKRSVCLGQPSCMAKTCEYMNGEVFRTVDRCGRVLIKAIEVVGMQRLEPLWNLKLFIESLPVPFSGVICDKFLYWMNPLLPASLPPALMDLGKTYEHHLLVELAEYSDGEVARLEGLLEGFARSRKEGEVQIHHCEGWERNRANYFRFVVAPAFRTLCVGRGVQGLSIDYALPKSSRANPVLPEADYPVQNRLIYSHFGCNVFHEDLVYGPDVNVDYAKKAVKKAVEGTGGKLPAEHGHGVEYTAPKEAQERWMRMDPTNVLNPGVGGTSFKRRYAE